MRASILWLILGMTAVTFLPRLLPMALLSRFKLSPRLRLALSLVPVAILSALVAPSLFASDQSALAFQPLPLLAAVPVVALSLRTRKLWLAVLTGMLAYWLLGFIIK